MGRLGGIPRVAPPPADRATARFLGAAARVRVRSVPSRAGVGRLLVAALPSWADPWASAEARARARACYARIGAPVQVRPGNQLRPVLTVRRLLGLAQLLEDADKQASRNRPRRGRRSLCSQNCRYLAHGFGLWLSTLFASAASPWWPDLSISMTSCHRPCEIRRSPSFPAHFYRLLLGLGQSGARPEKRLSVSPRRGVRFPTPGPPTARTVVQSRYGRLSVLIRSELIEARLVAELVGRAEVVLVPSWNTDTSVGTSN